MKTIFAALQREHPEQFGEGQLRTLQRKVKHWRATEGPAPEVYFVQEHRAGELCESDFTHLTELGVSIAGEEFPHLLYHFVLTYSNWETGTICYSESFASLSKGLQQALWELGGVPGLHRTDRMTAAVNNLTELADFQRSYQALMRHHGMEGRKIQTGRPNENGDVEQRHYRFKRALEQGLLLRGSRDFSSVAEYELFLKRLFEQLNSGRKERLAEEMEVLRPLPERRFDSAKRVRVRVSSGSLINVERNSYSVNSRLIGEIVEARIFANHLEVWYGGQKLEQLPRLRGRTNYRKPIARFASFWRESITKSGFTPHSAMCRQPSSKPISRHNRSRPLRSGLFYEFSEASGNLSIRWKRRRDCRRPRSSSG